MPFTATLVLFALAQAAPAAGPVELSQPSAITQLDGGKLKGEPVQLAWSPDGAQLFVQTAQRDGQGMITKPRYYVLPAAGGDPKSADAPPAWATEYWSWKSFKAAPSLPAFAIDVKEDWRQLSSTSTPMGGAYARGGGVDATAGTTVGDVANATLQNQKEHVFLLTLKGENIGEFVNSQFLPGYTFGWAPQPMTMVAYGNAAGHLAVMDDRGRKQESGATRNVILPAWSPDGKKIAFIQKMGKNKYDLSVIDVTR